MMKRFLSLFTIVLIVVVLCLGAKPAAAGAPGLTVKTTCNSISVSGLGSPPPSIPIEDYTTGQIVGTAYFVQTSPTTFSGGGTFTANRGDILDLGGLLFTSVCGAESAGFNPGDNRVDGRAGDRIAVYCNRGNPNTITAYGVDDDSQGLYLGTVSVTDLVKKGAIEVNGPHGTVTFGSWGNNIFTAKWNGPFNGFSKAPFGKKFTCTFA